MKVNPWGNKRIAHTHIPMMATARHLGNHQELDSSFFYKIKGNIKLLEPTQAVKSNQIQQQLFGTRFIISKRLQALSQSRMKKHKRDSLTARNTQRPCNTIRLIPHQHSLHSHKPNQSQDVELADVNKTISGTRIGALSSLQIMKNMDEEEEKKQQEQLLRSHKYLNPVDSEPNDQVAQRQGPTSTKRSRGTFSKNKKRLKAAKRSKDNEQLLQTIFGGEQFLQKHKQYQTLLMEKSMHYKSKTLSLDYKNEWRI